MERVREGQTTYGPVRRGSLWVSLDMLEGALFKTKAPVELREAVMRLARVNAVQGEVLEPVSPEEEGRIFDEYLGKVSQDVFGRSLSELSEEELGKIGNIRKELGIPGEFNPDNPGRPLR